MHRIILVEDEEHLRYGLEFNLKKEGFLVTGCSSAETGLDAWRESDCDLFLLDIMLPGMSGLEMLEIIREKDLSCPVVMLTARSDESDAVVALELGADDYVRKPFGVSELIARLRRILRRLPQTGVPLGTIGPWTLDLDNYRISRNDQVMSLTNMECAILQLLLANPGAVVSREDLLEKVWGPGMSTLTRTLDNHVARLRRKIELDPKEPTILLTVHGIGYKLASNSN